jgi:polyisoprenoid-binding protein YceI
MARFRILPEASAVFIDARSSVHPINTKTEGLEGFVDLRIRDDGKIDLTDAPSGELSLSVERMKSGNPLEDRELRRRIDARRFPTIDGRMTAMQATSEHGRYLVAGDVTFKGVTRSYEEEITVTPIDDGGRLRLEGAAEFDVRDFGMEPPRILMLRVYPEVRVRIDVVAEKEAT